MQMRFSNKPMFAAVAAVLFLVGCDNPRSKKNSGISANHQPPASPVHYVKVTLQIVAETLDLPAKVQADPTKVVRIFPPASGRVTSIAVKPGDRVRVRQPLATLNSSDVASAQSDFAKAKIEAERATHAMKRQKVLFEHGATAEKDYLDSRAQAESARAELARATQRLRLLNVSPSETTDQVSLLSPAGGIVLDVSAAPGEFSRSLDSASPLITIADINTVWIVGDVYEKDLARVSRGKQVSITIQAYPTEQWTAQIDSLAGALDPVTRTLKVRVSLANPSDRLKPEMFGAIHVKAGKHEALVVPAAAIIREGDSTTVFVKSGDKPEQHTVTVGQAIGGTVEILSGLRAGDEVAAEGAELLTGGPSE
jgi:cobalt-zinc-cadmium efflux system membrane fusion protein